MKSKAIDFYLNSGIPIEVFFREGTKNFGSKTREDIDTVIDHLDQYPHLFGVNGGIIVYTGVLSERTNARFLQSEYRYRVWLVSLEDFELACLEQRVMRTMAKAIGRRTDGVIERCQPLTESYLAAARKVLASKMQAFGITIPTDYGQSIVLGSSVMIPAPMNAN